MLPAMITRTQFVLAVPDLEKSSTFYRNVLGFAIHELAPGWLRYERDGVTVYIGDQEDRSFWAQVKRQVDVLGEAFAPDEFLSQLEAEHHRATLNVETGGEPDNAAAQVHARRLVGAGQVIAYNGIAPGPPA